MLIRGDARALPLNDARVNCCITSPPYFGLRDYGTARWEGGDPACAHQQEPPRFNGPKQTVAQVSGHASKAESHARSHCPRCGAQRIDAQIGLEPTPEAYVQTLVAVFREVRRVLTDDGVCWLNLGDSYANSAAGRTQAGFNARYFGRPDWNDGKQAAAAETKPNREVPDGLKAKDLLGIPWRVAFALQADGWYLRSDVIWAKPNPMPESVTDRPTKAHEYLFLLSKCERYYYDADAIREPLVELTRRQSEQRRLMRMNRGVVVAGVLGQTSKGVDDGALPTHMMRSNPDGRNKRSVWTIPTMPYSGSHFAVMPEKLVEPCILAGCPLGGLVLDPFCGSGTVIAVAQRLGRRGVGVDLTYQPLAKERTAQQGFLFEFLEVERPVDV
jgi:DNA modification methylase